ncbi:glycine betaine/proline transport system substrate-binding protein [Mesobacillus persicus]|uniref:Glycine betaine/proline transport system substrate-binding protein n=1 Tax=Mesobacillus persicus TaxID=930146 RepID=A0A1H8CD09_9BACI|nr:glycine betaine ABC transporter substrate-binding protein [Mesobacillus persicus]SEM93151.1 glycine betaine/proline transport system substrate-binding protein [Mesobacillus persicus]
MFKKLVGITSALTLTLGLAACGGTETSSDSEGATKSVGEQVDYKIIGIDPGAGIMNLTINDVLPGYELDEWEVVEGSGSAMAAALKKAYDKEEPIIVTGWSPHWKFASYDLKYLEDPKGIYGGAEDVNTIVRQGLKEDHPDAYKLLDQFQWEPEHIETVMNLIQEGSEPAEAAAQWASENEELVSTWTEGVNEVDGEELTLLYVAWDDVIASSHVAENALESVGYDVKLVQVDAGPMWAGVADGSGDALVGAWLPTTHADYYAEYEGKFEDLGANLTGTKLGLVVPAYMDVDSIEDLK